MLMAIYTQLFIDIIKPEPMKVPKSNIYYEDPLKEATRLPGYNKSRKYNPCLFEAWRGKELHASDVLPPCQNPITQRSTGSSEKSVSWC